MHARTLGAVATAIAIAATMFTFQPTASAAPSAEGDQSSYAAKAKRKCFAVRSPGESQSHLECYKFVKKLNTPYKVGYRDSLVNRTNRTAQLDCEASESKTFSWGASVTVGAEIKASVFASIKAEVSANVERTVSSGKVVKAGVPVPPRTTTYCDRVVYIPRYLVRKCNVYQGGGESCRNTTWEAPSRAGWVLKDAPK